MSRAKSKSAEPVTDGKAGSKRTKSESESRGKGGSGWKNGGSWSAAGRGKLSGFPLGEIARTITSSLGMLSETSERVGTAKTAPPPPETCGRWFAVIEFATSVV